MKMPVGNTREMPKGVKQCFPLEKCQRVLNNVKKTLKDIGKEN
jgi:hypothetical protein